MASIQIGALFLFFLLFLPLPSTPTTLYVKPTSHTPCSYNPCHTLSEYVENATEYFTSNTTMIFLPGEHTLKTQAYIANTTSFTMVGESEDTSRILCNGSRCGGFYFKNISYVSIRNLVFVNQAITVQNVNDAQFENCVFANNSRGIAALSDSTIMFQGNNTFINNAGNAMFADNSMIVFNGSTNFSSNTGVIVGGGIYLFHSNVIITSTGMVSLINNYAPSGGGMYLYNSLVNITGNLSLINNSAESGGGLYLDSDSKLYFFPTTTVTSHMISFSENHAQRGGAIYVVDESPLAYCSNAIQSQYVLIRIKCFFQIPNANVSDLGKLLVFEGNRAEEAGSALYGGAVDNCTLEGHPNADSGKVFDTIVNISDSSANLSSSIASNPFQVYWCNKSQLDFPCSSCAISINVSLFPGQIFPMPLVALGQRKGTAPAYVMSSFGKPSQSVYLSFGPFENSQKVDKTCTELHYSVFSTAKPNQGSSQITLSAEGPCSTILEPFKISFSLRSCPTELGFTLGNNGGCICEKKLRKYTDNCNITDQTIHRDGDFWVKYNNQSQSQGLILHPHCPFDYCQRKPVSFTLNETDLQCEYSRTGLLCGACQPGLSLALGSSRCLQCSNFYLFLSLLFPLMGLALVVLLLACKLTVAIGTLSGLLFYANIVGANQNIFFPPDSTNPLAVFVAWLNLDFGIETCFYDGMDAYAKIWLQFAFPIYIWAIIGLIIFISGRSPRISRMFGSNPVAVLATLFLLSYAKIVRIIIAALSFTTLQYPNNEVHIVWLYDANIRYLHGKHIALFTVAVLFFAFLFLPYTLLLLLGQWFQARSYLTVFSWMDNHKLRAFLDTYHAPYKDHHRYWPGLLLIVRLVLLLVFGLNALQENRYSVNLLAISVASFGLMLLAWLSNRIYKNWYKDALEASYILNLGTLTVATYYTKQENGSQVAVAYCSTGVAFTTFTAIVLYHIYLQTKESRFWKEFFRNRDDYHVYNPEKESQLANSVGMGNRPVVVPKNSIVSYGIYNQIREPLLDAQ